MTEPIPPAPRETRVVLPDWTARADTVDFDRTYGTDEERMALVVRLARENVRHGTGGPFGAAIFEGASGRLIAVGVNRVVPLNNSVLHAEVVAMMMAQARLGVYSLSLEGLPEHELFTSCEPCAMCLGAIQWSGVRRVVWAATREDAGRLHFDEGPVFRASYLYLAARGIRFSAGPLREEARTVLAEYEKGGGEIYNG
jgi:tRNA(Arg) A34 adenosine deaminase TadA